MSSKPGKCTLEDIARSAGVSAPTVSRVINKFPRISETTRREVEAAMERLGYRPPAVERKPREKKKNAFPTGIRCGKVMFLVPDVSEVAAKTFVTAQLTSGVATVLSRNGVELLLSRLKAPDELPDGFSPANIDGVICKNWPKSPVVAEAIRRMPHVWCLATPVCPGLGDQVFLDSDLTAQYAAEFFSERGYRRVILISSRDELSQRNRAVALEEVFKEAAVPFQFHFLNQATIESIEFAPGTGVIVDSADFFLPAVYIRLMKLNLRIHSEVELLAMNISRAQLDSIDSTLSRLELNPVAIGEGAAEMLLWRKAHPDEPVRRLMIASQPDFR